MSRHLLSRRGLLSAVLVIALAGCIPLAIEAPERIFEVASTDGPTTIRFAIGDRGFLGQPRVLSGIQAIDLEELGSPPCTDTSTVYDSLTLQIVDPDSDRVLHERDLLKHPACDEDRYVWSGQDLIELDDDERWPDGLYLAYDTFEVASTAGPIMLTFPIGDRELAIAYNVSGREQVSLLELGSSSACTDTSHYEPLAMRIRDRNRDGAVLHERDLLESPVCADDRYLWDGQGLIELEDDETWPDGLYRTPDIDQGPRPLPTYRSSARG